MDRLLQSTNPIKEEDILARASKRVPEKTAKRVEDPLLNGNKKIKSFRNYFSRLKQEL